MPGRFAIKPKIALAASAAIAICSFQTNIWAAPAALFKAQNSVDVALALEDRGKWRDAVAILRNCVNARPEHKDAWLELGRCLIQIKQFDEASRILQLAKGKFPSAATQKFILQNLIFCDTQTGRLEALQEAWKEYAARFPNDKDTPALLEKMDYYRVDFESTRKAEATGQNLRLEGYLPWLQFTKLPQVPIRVYVSPDKAIAVGNTLYTKSVNQRYELRAKQALLRWAAAANPGLAFVFVEQPQDAQLRCEWTTDAKKKTHSWSGGEQDEIQNSTQGSVCSVAQIFLDSKKQMNEAEFYYVCLHEVGHALGLQHSSIPGDIMYHAQTMEQMRMRDLSNNDIIRIRRVYSDPVIGKAVAEQFAQSAFVIGDYKQAYGFLSTEQQEQLSKAQLQENLEGEQGRSRAAFLQVTHFERTPKINRFSYGLEGRNEHSKFYYHVAVVRGRDGGFSVDQFNRVAVEPITRREMNVAAN